MAFFFTNVIVSIQQALSQKLAFQKHLEDTHTGRCGVSLPALLFKNLPMPLTTSGILAPVVPPEATGFTLLGK